MTTKMKLFERLLLVVIIACGASFTANAQLGGLLNKAKTAVSKDKQSNNNQNAQQSSSNSQSSSQSSSPGSGTNYTNIFFIHIISFPIFLL